MLQSMGLQRVRHNLVTDQQQQEKLKETKRKKGVFFKSNKNSVFRVTHQQDQPAAQSGKA